MKRGDYVIALDNFFTGRHENVKHLDNFDIVRHDVTQPFFIECDEIYNLACPASPPHYQRDPVQTMKTCVLGAINVLENAKRVGARVFQASTSEVYGDPTVHPQVEEYRGNVNTIGPRSCYDEGKRAAETLFFDYHHMYDVDIRVARIFNTYGPHMCANDGRVVSNFVCQALVGAPITLYGDGSQTRSFCYVSDLIKGFLALMGDDGGQVPVPVNLGNPHEFTVKQLAELVIEMTRSKSEIVYEKLPVDDPTRRKPDITRAKQRLGWEPNVPLATGLHSTIKYFAKQLGL